MAIRILGAGMAGLLAANMLRKYEPVIYEAKDELPDNHGALLRFRSTSVADATGQHFKKVLVRKGIENGMRPTIDVCNEYSYKVTGAVDDRSIWNLDPVERYIAPDDFLEVLARGCNIVYNWNVQNLQQIRDLKRLSNTIISTIPMPVLMRILAWKDVPKFNYKTIWVYRYRINMSINVHQTMYFPYDDTAEYRATITGDLLTVECIRERVFFDGEISKLLWSQFGLPPDVPVTKDGEGREMKYGKILPIDEELRRAFILYATREWGIYSVGRFATWRQLLLDDVVEDVRIVERFIRGSEYERDKELLG